MSIDLKKEKITYAYQEKAEISGEARFCVFRLLRLFLRDFCFQAALKGLWLEASPPRFQRGLSSARNPYLG